MPAKSSGKRSRRKGGRKSSNSVSSIAQKPTPQEAEFANVPTPENHKTGQLPIRLRKGSSGSEVIPEEKRESVQRCAGPSRQSPASTGDSPSLLICMEGYDSEIRDQGRVTQTVFNGRFYPHQSGAAKEPLAHGLLDFTAQHFNRRTPPTDELLRWSHRTMQYWRSATDEQRFWKTDDEESQEAWERRTRQRPYTAPAHQAGGH